MTFTSRLHRRAVLHNDVKCNPRCFVIHHTKCRKIHHIGKSSSKIRPSSLPSTEPVSDHHSVPFRPIRMYVHVIEYALLFQFPFTCTSPSFHAHSYSIYPTVLNPCWRRFCNRFQSNCAKGFHVEKCVSILQNPILHCRKHPLRNRRLNPCPSSHGVATASISCHPHKPCHSHISPWCPYLSHIFAHTRYRRDTHNHDAHATNFENFKLSIVAVCFTLTDSCIRFQ